MANPEPWQEIQGEEFIVTVCNSCFVADFAVHIIRSMSALLEVSVTAYTFLFTNKQVVNKWCKLGISLYSEVS